MEMYGVIMSRINILSNSIIMITLSLPYVHVLFSGRYIWICGLMGIGRWSGRGKGI